MSGRFGSYRTSYGTSYRRRGRGRGGLTGNQLKTLGGLFLLLDHIGAVVIQGGSFTGGTGKPFWRLPPRIWGSACWPCPGFCAIVDGWPFPFLRSF